ncbi:TPA: hypothetical protein N0F65_007651 [Lagenidium giganteum]|uniref:TFIIS N-terminal domain-containing protein n=1 Tax=Lagenidium giganteum TaxID=4803 RepID=A0AAV2Z7D5_9STRA|nr:TPA: hypothetical protein N0F65_007651 [Lagenidium giganteum]
MKKARFSLATGTAQAASLGGPSRNLPAALEQQKALQAVATHGNGAAQRLRQITITHGAKVVVEEVVQHLKDELDDARTDANVLGILHELEQHFISLEMLEKTRIGVSLTRAMRRSDSEEVKQKACCLLKEWKRRAKKAMRRRQRRVRMFGRNAGE